MILNCEVVKKGFSNENVELLNTYFLTELIENHEEKDEFDYNREVYPLRISKKKNRRQNINLLLISDGEMKHYCLISDMGRLLPSQTSKYKKSKEHFPRCLNHFSSKEKSTVN